MGDVALTTPVLSGMRKQYPDIELVLLTRAVFEPFFNSVVGLRFFFPDFIKRHNGLTGLIRLFREIIKQHKIDTVIDLHDVMRSKILRSLFRLSGVQVFTIDKGRNEKVALIRGREKHHLKHTVERYCDVFARAGFAVFPDKGPCIIPSSEGLNMALSMMDSKDVLNIGVAPYANFDLKMWPEGKMLQLLQLISDKYKSKFWLFGGEEESARLTALQSRIADSSVVLGNHNLDGELALMSKLDFMIAMDSSNMHMASLVGTRVISIWGGTDPLSGFGAWMQPDNYSVRIPVNKLTCRPCTIFGKGDCRRGDFACMNRLTPEIVFERVKKMVLPGNYK